MFKNKAPLDELLPENEARMLEERVVGKFCEPTSTETQSKWVQEICGT